ncbi:hypothetical protein CXU22_11820 [Akkermansia muciniphila]|uniref:Uncharacterized protein n=1 Tax=Akkermansia muciniphila TaxID=239935 RepID=A0A2N8HBS0_9BACT|nr:hypothetical protein CXU22_11820 [Akkermansia muciniphila]
MSLLFQAHESLLPGQEKRVGWDWIEGRPFPASPESKFPGKLYLPGNEKNNQGNSRFERGGFFIAWADRP